MADTLELNMEYILSRIDRIIEGDQHIKDAINAIHNMLINDSPNGGVGDSARANAITQSIQSREATNQQVLRLLEKMYDDLKPQKNYEHIANNVEELLNSHVVLEKCIEALDDIDEDNKQEGIQELYGIYEASRRYLAEKIIAQAK